MATDDDDALANNRDVFAKTLRMEETQFGREDPRLAETLKSLGETQGALGLYSFEADIGRSRCPDPAGRPSDPT